MADESLLREILESPLDDLPPRRGFEFTWLVWIAVGVLIVVAGLVWMRSGDDSVDTAAATDPGVASTSGAETAGAGDATTTTKLDIERGIVNIVVGIAPSKPAEFVILHIEQIAGLE